MTKTLQELWAGSYEPMPKSAPVLIFLQPQREYWRVWEPTIPKDVPSTRYKLIMRNGVNQ